MSLGIQSFSHVVMQVGDLEAAIAFYGGLLGLERTFEQPYPDPAGGAPLRAFVNRTLANTHSLWRGRVSSRYAM